MTTAKRPRRKSRLYNMRIGQRVFLKEYDYGVSHISKRTGKKFIQRTAAKTVVCMRVK